ncbi:hypothetical protein G6F56_009718 [Rhizopus delemar]|nr:hypothetical protein G6F56_009718 [Rhizopus delemar]
MSKKRKRNQDHIASIDYNLPTTKTSGRTSRATSFKPNENELRELLNNAFKSRLSRLIQTYLKQGDSKSKNENLKTVEQKRRKVPPGTFEALGDQYGAYWSANTFDLDTIILIEFQTNSRPVLLPSIPRVPTSNDVTYNDYKNLFSLSHLQVISTLNFGTTGVQSKTLTNHPLWGEIQRKKSKASSSQVENAALQEDEGAFDQQFQKFIDSAKSVNTTIKKSVVKQLSTNLDNI